MLSQPSFYGGARPNPETERRAPEMGQSRQARLGQEKREADLGRPFPYTTFLGPAAARGCGFRGACEQQVFLRSKISRQAPAQAHYPGKLALFFFIGLAPI